MQIEKKDKTTAKAHVLAPVIPGLFCTLCRKVILFIVPVMLVSIAGQVSAQGAASIEKKTIAGVARGIPNDTQVHVEMLGAPLRSTDLERSTRFYTTGLGMTVIKTLVFDTGSEVILRVGASDSGPIITLYKKDSPEAIPPVSHGTDGFTHILLRTSDVTALAKQLSSAGYDAGDIHTTSVNNRKGLSVKDPDGYTYEITELPSTRR